MVSLIIPCYNSESYIERCLDSILVQNYKQIELILVNDGSVDDTEHKIDQMRTRIESNTERFIYIKQKNILSPRFYGIWQALSVWLFHHCFNNGCLIMGCKALSKRL